MLLWQYFPSFIIPESAFFLVQSLPGHVLSLTHSKFVDDALMLTLVLLILEKILDIRGFLSLGLVYIEFFQDTGLTPGFTFV